MTDTRDRNTPDDDARSESPHEQIIDVSGREPIIIERADEGADFPFAGYAPQRVRVFVAGGGARTCAIPIIFILLTLCCGCLGFWAITDNLF